MRASRGTLPLARTSRSMDEWPSNTAFARMGLRFTRRLLVADTKFSFSMYEVMMGRSSAGR